MPPENFGFNSLDIGWGGGPSGRRPNQVQAYLPLYMPILMATFLKSSKVCFAHLS